jgi:hypothetical protein
MHLCSGSELVACTKQPGKSELPGRKSAALQLAGRGLHQLAERYQIALEARTVRQHLEAALLRFCQFARRHTRDNGQQPWSVRVVGIGRGSRIGRGADANTNTRTSIDAIADAYARTRRNTACAANRTQTKNELSQSRRCQWRYEAAGTASYRSALDLNTLGL